MNDQAPRFTDVADELPRPYSFVVERAMAVPPGAVFDAWINRFDTWFASPGEISMNAATGQPYWFDVVHQGQHSAHYGRFLRLEKDRVVEQTWVTGQGGTNGAETVVAVELVPTGSGTLLRLTHGGFYDEASARQHRDSWPLVLEHLEQVLRNSD